MRFEPGVVHLATRRLALQPARELERRCRMRAHAQLQRFEALEEHPGIERTHARTGRADEAEHVLADQLLVADARRRRRSGPGRRDTWSPNESPGPRRARTASAAPACRSSCRPRAARRARARCRRCARMSAITDSGFDGVSRKNSRVLRPDRRAPGVVVVRPHVGHFDAELHQVAIEQRDRRAEHAVGTHDVIARLEQRHAGRQDRGHARAGARRRPRRLPSPRAAPRNSARSDW